METKQKFNIIFTCKFSDFAQAFSGLSDPEKIIEESAHNDDYWDERMPIGDNFLSEADLREIWDSYVEIRIEDRSNFTNGFWLLSLTVINNNRKIYCDCAELEDVLLNIIKRNI